MDNLGKTTRKRIGKAKQTLSQLEDESRLRLSSLCSILSILTPKDEVIAKIT
jgi:hypothetical protein